MQMIPVRLDAEERRRLDGLAANLGISRAAVLRRALSAAGEADKRDGFNLRAHLELQASLRDLVRAYGEANIALNRIALGINSGSIPEAGQLGPVLCEIIRMNRATREALRAVAGKPESRGSGIAARGLEPRRPEA